MTREPGLNAAYDLQGPEDNRRLYADWAATYDTDFAAAMDYRLPALVADAFVRAGGRGPVLDIGAGTGLVAFCLAHHGISPIDGTDISPEMLAVAAQKGHYARLFEGNVLDRLHAADGSYQGIVSSGTFTLGHVGPAALSEVLRLLAPGGLACLSINAAHFASAGFGPALENLAPHLAALTLTEVDIYGPGASGDHAGDKGYIALFRKT